jgi:hypothetical protein
MRGVTGLIGITGIKGETGIIGITGIRGVTGLIGITGIKGVTGIIGITGIIGVTGLIGITGFRGVTGVQGLVGNQGATGVSGVTGAMQFTGVFTLALDGVGSAITTGEKAVITLPFGMQINGWRMIGTPTGTVYLNLALSTYSAYPFTGPLMHSGTTGPHIQSGIKNQSTDLSAWQGTTGAYGDLLSVNVASASSITNAYLTVMYTRTQH